MCFLVATLHVHENYLHKICYTEIRSTCHELLFEGDAISVEVVRYFFDTAAVGCMLSNTAKSMNRLSIDRLCCCEGSNSGGAENGNAGDGFERDP